MVRLTRLATPFLLLCFVGLVGRLGYQMARSPVLPRFADHLGASPELTGVILGASTVTGVFLKLPSGALSDILGRRRMLLLGAAFFAAPPFLYLLVTDVYGLLALRFLHGFATAIFSPVASAAVADLFQKGRGERLGWFALSNEIGSAAAPLVGGLLLSATASNFKLLFLLVGMIGTLTFLLVIMLPVGRRTSGLSPTAPAGGRWKQFLQGMGEVIRNRPILVASSAEAAMFLGVGALVGFLPLYAVRHVGLSDAQVGVILGSQLVMAMAAKPLTGRLSDKLGRKPVILVGLVLCAVMLPLVPLTRSLLLLIGEGALFGLGMAIVTPSTTAVVADLSKTGGYGAALGVFGTIWDVGEAIGPILAGALIGAFAVGSANPYSPTFFIIAGIMLGVTLLFALLVPEPEKP